ncbi:nucleoside phosphorylase domain-containing protein [Aspergillus crustosus]
MGRKARSIRWMVSLEGNRRYYPRNLTWLMRCSTKSTDLPVRRSNDNTYIFGRICSHNVVISCLSTGSIRFGLMVGIGGGIPNKDIRLGDVVIGRPMQHSGGVLQCDVDFERTSTLNKPPVVLLNALSILQARHIMNGNRIPGLPLEMQEKHPLMKRSITPAEPDRQFQGHYGHTSPRKSCCQCDERYLIDRPKRRAETPQIHYGLIASVTKVVKDARTRDYLAQRHGISCIEMEAAGLMDRFPCLVIRGIFDYADSHKNDHWQGYAAATAAAYAKELLSVIPPEEVENEKIASQL